MYSFFAGLILFGLICGIIDFSHPSYGFAAVIAGILFCLYLKLEGKIRFRMNLWILSALFLLVNGFWLLVFRIAPSVDFATFWDMACRMSGAYSVENHYVALFPHIFGYSWFLSLFLKLFCQSIAVAVILNLLLSLAAGLLIYAMLFRAYGEESAAFGFLLWTFCPSKMIFNAMVLSEPYYTALLLIFFWISQQVDCSGKAPVVMGILSGFVLRFINTARPIALIPVIAYGIWLILLKGCKKQTTLYAACFLSVYFASGLLWNGYMTERLGEQPAAGVPGYSIYVGFNTETGGEYSDSDMDELIDLYYGDGHSAPEAQQIMFERAKERIFSGNIEWGRLLVSKFRAFLGNDEAGAFYASEALPPKEYSALCIVSNIYYYFLIFLALSATLKTVRVGEFDVLQTIPIFVIGLILAQMLVEVAGRYHYSIIPMLVLVVASKRRRQWLPG